MNLLLDLQLRDDDADPCRETLASKKIRFITRGMARVKDRSVH